MKEVKKHVVHIPQIEIRSGGLQQTANPLYANCTETWIRSRAFSLIELLTVMAMMAVLMTLVAPMMKGVGDSHNLRSAADIISTVGMLARQNSLGQNAMTAVVILQQAAPEGKALRSISAFELRQRSDGTALTSQDWKQILPWRQLPAGILVDSDTTASSFLLGSASQPSPPLPANLQVGDTSTSSYSYQVFQPNGRLLNTQSATVKVIPAVLQNGQRTLTSAKSGNSTLNYLTVTFLASTGQTRVFQP